MNRYYSPGVLLIGMVLLAGLLLIGMSLRQYLLHTQKTLLPKLEASEFSSAAMLEEIQMLFGQAVPAASQYASISELNMFSPDRRPWSPPPAQAPSPTAEPERSLPIAPGGIRLYGTTISTEQNLALLYFERFASSRKYFLAREGDTVRDEGERGETVYYQVVSVFQDRVELLDAQGNSVTIGLYDHQRSVASPGLPPPNIVMQQRQPQVQHQTVPRQSIPNAQPIIPEGADPQQALSGLPDSMEEREQLVREGRLTRIDTPFGPVYRPVE